jgi:hypothetical protein
MKRFALFALLLTGCYRYPTTPTYGPHYGGPHRIIITPIRPEHILGGAHYARPIHYYHHFRHRR